MKNNHIKNLKVVGASFCLGAVLLTSCTGHTELSISNNSIVYDFEKNTVKGTIDYENLIDYVRVVELKIGEEKKPFLLIKKVSNTFGKEDIIEYFDFKSGAAIFKYYQNDEGEMTWVRGENIMIVEEHELTSYLLKENFIQKKYKAEEIIQFYEDKILPTLEENDKELVK